MGQIDPACAYVLNGTYICDLPTALSNLVSSDMAPRRYLLLFLFGVPSYQRECTNAPPVTIPITDVALSSGHAIRGALMTVGNPPQNLSWIPQM
jgi:hypothetical protein